MSNTITPKHTKIIRNMIIYIMHNLGIPQSEIAKYYNISKTMVSRTYRTQKLKYQKDSPNIYKKRKISYKNTNKAT